MEVALSADFENDEVERWFVHRGVPQAIFHYNAAEDVFTRMVPFLAAVFLLGALAGFGDRFSGWAQAGVAVAAFTLLSALAALVNKLRGRRMFALPEDVGLIELAAFIMGAPLVALLFGDAKAMVLQLLAVNVAILIVGYGVTSYGAVPMIRWGLREVTVQLKGLVRLLAKSLPLLLLFATFLFLNAELWQVAHDLTPAFFVVVLAMVLVPALLFVLLRSPTEVANLAQFDSWVEVDAICRQTDAPIPVIERTCDDAPELVPLDRGERRNFALLMIVAQAVQILLVATVIGAFYVSFGLFAVRRKTILQWTDATADTFEPIAQGHILGGEVVLTWQLLAVAGVIAAISALQFAVSLVTDELYRQQFFDSVENQIREVLAVRARYLEPLVLRANTDDPAVGNHDDQVDIGIAD